MKSVQTTQTKRSEGNWLILEPKKKQQLCEKYSLTPETVERVFATLDEAIDAQCEEERRCIDLDAEEKKPESIPAEPEALGEVSPEAKTQSNPGLRTIRQWLSNRMYTEKLCAILVCQLLEKENTFDEPDDDIANQIITEWEQEIIEASGDIKKLIYDNSGLSEESVAELAVVTSTVSAWIPWVV